MNPKKSGWYWVTKGVVFKSSGNNNNHNNNDEEDDNNNGGGNNQEEDDDNNGDDDGYGENGPQLANVGDDNGDENNNNHNHNDNFNDNINKDEDSINNTQDVDDGNDHNGQQETTTTTPTSADKEEDDEEEELTPDQDGFPLIYALLSVFGEKDFNLVRHFKIIASNKSTFPMNLNHTLKLIRDDIIVGETEQGDVIVDQAGGDLNDNGDNHVNHDTLDIIEEHDGDDDTDVGGGVDDLLSSLTRIDPVFNFGSTLLIDENPPQTITPLQFIILRPLYCLVQPLCNQTFPKTRDAFDDFIQQCKSTQRESDQLTDVVINYYIQSLLDGDEDEIHKPIHTAL